MSIDRMISAGVEVWYPPSDSGSRYPILEEAAGFSDGEEDSGPSVLYGQSSVYDESGPGPGWTNPFCEPIESSGLAVEEHEPAKAVQPKRSWLRAVVIRSAAPVMLIASGLAAVEHQFPGTIHALATTLLAQFGWAGQEEPLAPPPPPPKSWMCERTGYRC